MWLGWLRVEGPPCLDSLCFIVGNAEESCNAVFLAVLMHGGCFGKDKEVGYTSSIGSNKTINSSPCNPPAVCRRLQSQAGS